MNDMKRIIYIASLGHSGSTVLDLILGGHSRFIGLGEIAPVIKVGGIQQTEIRQSLTHLSLCSCGSKLHQCPFWGEVVSRLQSHNDLTFEERYKTVLEVFDDLFGQDYIPVDSSKYIHHLKVLNTKLQLDIKVLYIIKDVRNFTISQIDNIQRKEKHRGRNHDMRRIPAYTFWWWYLKNKKMQRFFTDQKMQVLQIGYEELCLYPKLMVQRICDFLEEEVELSMLTLKNSQSHVMRGNRMRTQKDKSEIVYDHRWFFRHEWILPTFFFPNIMRYNAKEVYGNNTETIWTQ
jgi:hypothetical protein